MPDLNISVRSNDTVSIVEPVGYLNAHTAKHFEDVLQNLVDENRLLIVINCHRLDYIASAGLGVIMGFIDTVRENSGDIRLCAMNSTVKSIFEVLGFTELYSIFDNEEKAIRSFSETA
jgi:anti-sigma B factor antagonist